MKRVALYSSSKSSRSLAPPKGNSPPSQAGATGHTTETSPGSASDRPLLLTGLIRRHHRIPWVALGGLLALVLVWWAVSMTPSPRRITQKDIERAVLHTLETQPLPSPAAKALPPSTLPEVQVPASLGGDSTCACG